MMMNLLNALILALAVNRASARLGSAVTSGEGQGRRRLCAENRNGCVPFVNPCCDQFSCYLDGRCYELPRKRNGPCIPGLGECADGLTCDALGMRCREVGIAVNDKCNFSRQCEGTILGKKLTCDLFTNRCRLPGEIGDVCHGSRPCDDNLVCSTTSLTCQRPSREGQSCSVSQRCASGLTCDLTSSICRGRSGVGGRCHLSRRCESNLYCDLEVEECKNAALVGQKCNLYVPCANGNNVFCNEDGRCQEMPPKCQLEGGTDCGGLDDGSGGGDDTVGDDDVGDDDGGLMCNMATGKCETKVTPSPTITPSPSAGPTVATPAPSPAPTTLAPTTPSPTPIPTTPNPTYSTNMPTKQEERCPLTGCPSTQQQKIPVQQQKEPSTGGDRISMLETQEQQTRGGSGAMHHPGRRHLVKGESKPQ